MKKTHPSPQASSKARAFSWTPVQLTVTTPLLMMGCLFFLARMFCVCVVFVPLNLKSSPARENLTARRTALCARGLLSPQICAQARPPPQKKEEKNDKKHKTKHKNKKTLLSLVREDLQRHKREPHGAREGAPGRLCGGVVVVGVIVGCVLRGGRERSRLACFPPPTQPPRASTVCCVSLSVPLSLPVLCLGIL